MFLDVYARTGRIKLSCRVAGVSFKTHYRRLAVDPLYRIEFERAEQRIDTLMLSLFKKFQRAYRREKALPEISATVALMERVEAAEQGLNLIRQERARKRDIASPERSDTSTPPLEQRVLPQPSAQEEDPFARFGGPLGGSWMAG